MNTDDTRRPGVLLVLIALLSVVTISSTAIEAGATPLAQHATNASARSTGHRVAPRPPMFTKEQRNQIKRIRRLALASDNFTSSVRRAIHPGVGRIKFIGVGPASHKVHRAILRARHRTGLKVRWNPRAKFTRTQQFAAQRILRSDERIVRSSRLPFGCVAVQPDEANYESMQAMSPAALRADLGVDVCARVAYMGPVAL